MSSLSFALRKFLHCWIANRNAFSGIRGDLQLLDFAWNVELLSADRAGLGEKSTGLARQSVGDEERCWSNECCCTWLSLAVVCSDEALSVCFSQLTDIGSAFNCKNVSECTCNNNNNLRVSNRPIRVSNRTLIYNVCPTWPSRHSRHRQLCRFYRSRMNCQQPDRRLSKLV